MVDSHKIVQLWAAKEADMAPQLLQIWAAEEEEDSMDPQPHKEVDIDQIPHQMHMPTMAMTMLQEDMVVNNDNVNFQMTPTAPTNRVNTRLPRDLTPVTNMAEQCHHQAVVLPVDLEAQDTTPPHH